MRTRASKALLKGVYFEIPFARMKGCSRLAACAIITVYNSTSCQMCYVVQSGGKVHGPRRMLQKYFNSNFDPLSSGIDPN